MKQTKRLGALALALVMALSALTGCGGKNNNDSSSGSGSAAGSSSGDASGSSQVVAMELSGVTDPYLATSGLAGDAVVATMNGEDITAAELLYWLNSNVTSYLNQFYGQLSAPPWVAEIEEGVTFADQFKENALDAALFYRSLAQMGAAENLTPDASIAGSVNDQFASLVLQLGTEELANHVLWADLLTQDQFLYLNQCSDLYNQLQELYFGENSGNYPTDAEVNAWLDEGGYFRVKHILLMTKDQSTNEPLDEETIAEKKATADDLLSQLQAAEDPIALFDELMNEYSEDGGLATNPEGYVFNASDSLVGGFREATLELSVGEISDVVETDYGYHIMLRLPIDPADYRDQVIGEQMEEKVDQWQEDHGVETNENYANLDPAAFWDNCLSLQYAVQNELAARSNG